MSDELKFPDPSARRGALDSGALDSGALDERTALLIREAYLPPVASGEAENAYWNALEGRIMARVATADPARGEEELWSVLGRWAQVGLVAAAAIFAVAGVVGNSLGEPEEQVAYESVIQTATPEAISAPAQLITASDKSVQRDAALQYVLSY